MNELLFGVRLKRPYKEGEVITGDQIVDEMVVPYSRWRVSDKWEHRSIGRNGRTTYYTLYTLELE